MGLIRQLEREVSHPRISNQRSKEDDRVAAGVSTRGKGLQAHPSRHGESPREFGDLRDRPMVSGSVRKQEDNAVEPEVALFRADPSLKSLDVIEARLRLDESAESRTRDHDVGATEVACNGDRDLGAPME
jgi:hypothetical protein